MSTAPLTQTAASHVYPDSLVINPDTFTLVDREESTDGYIVPNKCGRDFLFYALQFFRPKEFGCSCMYEHPYDLEPRLGMMVSSRFAWTCLQFYSTPKFLKQRNLYWYINKKPIESCIDVLRMSILGICTNPLFTFDSEIKTSLNNNEVVGIHFCYEYLRRSHVMFVAGIDDDYLYVCDTHAVVNLPFSIQQIPTTKNKGVLARIAIDDLITHWTPRTQIWCIVQAS